MHQPWKPRVALAMIAVGALWILGAQRAPAEPRVTVAAINVDPSGPLVDFQPVHVTGSGFPPTSLIEIFECRGGAVNEFDCDPANAFLIGVDSAGAIDETFFVDAHIYLHGGGDVDCRTDPSGCIIGVGFLLDADEAATAPITFDPAAPLRPAVTATVEPSTGLLDGQVVVVRGQHLSFREAAYAFVCDRSPGNFGDRCDLPPEPTTGVPDGDGSIELLLPVRSHFTSPLGHDVECGEPATCAVIVTWGFTQVPDRIAEVPISFATPEPRRPEAELPSVLDIEPRFTG